MSYDAIMHKLSAAELTLSPQMQDVIQRVRETGLHKVAAPLYGLDEVTLKTAVQNLSTAMLLQHYKYEKIATGLDAYASLQGDLEKTAILGKALDGMKRFFTGARAAGEAVGQTAIPGLASKLEPMGRAVENFGTGGLAAPMSKQQQLGHQVAGMVRERAPQIEQGNALANQLRTRSTTPPQLPPAMQSAAPQLTPVPQFSGSQRIAPAKLNTLG